MLLLVSSSCLSCQPDFTLLFLLLPLVHLRHHLFLNSDLPFLPCFPSASRLSFSVCADCWPSSPALYTWPSFRSVSGLWAAGSTTTGVLTSIWWRFSPQLVFFFFYSCCLFAALLGSYWSPWWKAHSLDKTKRKGKQKTVKQWYAAL